MRGAKRAAILMALVLAGCAGTGQPSLPRLADILPDAPTWSTPTIQPAAQPPVASAPAPVQATPPMDQDSTPSSHRHGMSAMEALPAPAHTRPAESSKRSIIKIQPKIVINTPKQENAESKPSHSGHSSHARRSKSGSGDVFVHGYRRKNGYVHSYHRHKSKR
jgi:hypothetical protein